MNDESDKKSDKKSEKLKVYILCGPPGSGKSTWSKEFIKDAPLTRRVCPDEFRAKLGWGEGDQSVSHLAFQASYNALRHYLSLGLNVIVDATNMHCKGRKEFINIAREFDAYVVAMVFELDKETLLQRVQKRVSEGGRNIPEDVIDSMLEKYQRPVKPEFDQVIFQQNKL